MNIRPGDILKVIPWVRKISDCTTPDAVRAAFPKHVPVEYTNRNIAGWSYVTRGI